MENGDDFQVKVLALVLRHIFVMSMDTSRVTAKTIIRQLKERGYEIAEYSEGERTKNA